MRGSFGAVVLLLGVNPLDLRDPLVVQLGESLARLDLVVLVPESPELRVGRISDAEVPAIVAAVRYLQQLPEVDDERIGLAGFSVGASLAALAAANEEIAGELAALNLFGPYADARSLLQSVITEQQQLDGHSVAWTPSTFSRDAVQRMLLEAVEDEDDRSGLQTAIRESRNLTEIAYSADTAGTVARLLSTPEQNELVALLAELPLPFQERLDALSPVLVAERIKAPVFLMHDVGDTFVPVAESRRFREALPSSVLARYSEFNLFAHVVPEARGGPISLARELIGFWAHLRHLLGYLAYHSAPISKDAVVVTPCSCSSTCQILHGLQGVTSRTVAGSYQNNGLANDESSPIGL